MRSSSGEDGLLAGWLSDVVVIPTPKTCLLYTSLWSGRHFYLTGLPNLWRLTPNMDSLVAMGTGAAFLYLSLINI